MVVYNFGQVQHTRLREKQNVYKKTTAGDIAVVWTALFAVNSQWLRTSIVSHMITERTVIKSCVSGLVQEYNFYTM